MDSDTTGGGGDTQRSSGRLVTHVVRFLSGVNAQVALQGLQMAEASATGVTGVGLLARVDQDVGSQVSNLQPGQTQFTAC